MAIRYQRGKNRLIFLPILISIAMLLVTLFSLSSNVIAQDTTPPGVYDIVFDSDDRIIIWFSEPMNRTSTQTAVIIEPAISISGFEWKNNDTVVTLQLASYMSPGTAYTVTVLTDATDVAGNHMSWPVTMTIENTSGNDYNYLFLIVWVVLVGLGAIVFGFLLRWFGKKFHITPSPKEVKEYKYALYFSIFIIFLGVLLAIVYYLTSGMHGYGFGFGFTLIFLGVFVAVYNFVGIRSGKRSGKN